MGQFRLRRIGFPCLAFAAVLLAAALASSGALAQDRIALVVGNNRYTNLGADKQLNKAINDARAVGDALQKIGFKVIRGENLDRQGMVDRVFTFTQQIKQGDIAVLFYAGHGVAISGGNYLLPSDVRPAAPGEESRVRNMAIGEADIVADIQDKKARVAVLLLDACRDNPFRQPGLLRSAGNDAGLTRGREGEGVFAVYSAGFGQSALDSLGPNDRSENSVFTRVLVPALGRADAHLGDIVVDMREEVAKLASTVNHQQFPAYYDQTRGGRVYLAPRGSPAPAVASPAPVVAAPPPAAVVAAPPPAVVAAPPKQQVAAVASGERLRDLTRSDAAGFPSKPITLVVPFAPGGTSDLVARSLAESLSKTLGQPVIVENKPGVGGGVGAAQVAKAVPDGYTLLFGTQVSNATFPLITRPSPYNSETDFVPIALVANTPVALLVRKEIPVNDLRSFMAYLKANPGKLNLGTSGFGSLSHLACELLVDASGGKATQVPFAGTAPLMAALSGGQIDFVCDTNPSATVPMIKSGQVKALAVAAGERSVAWPNVPSAVEAGLPAFQAANWSALFAPKETPAPVAAKLNAAVFKALSEGAFKTRLAGLGIELPRPDRTTQSALGDLVRGEVARWKPVVAKIMN